MTRKYVLVSAVIVLLLSGCTYRDMYDAMQDQRREACRNGAPSDYEQCMGRYDTGYDQYEKERQQQKKF